jgi:AbrB family looped-hinge helix DNA binding protein
MKYTATLTSKGQLTLPIDLRTHLGLKPGDRIEFVSEKGEIKIRPVRQGNPFSQYIGALGGFSSTEEINTWVREMRDQEEDS